MRSSRSPPCALVHERDQRVADLEFDGVELQQVVHRVGRRVQPRPAAAPTRWHPVPCVPRCWSPTRVRASSARRRARGTGIVGSPGTRPNTPSTPAAMHIARGCAPSCDASTLPMREPLAACVTMRPAAVRDDERRDLRDESVADREHRVGRRRLCERQSALHDADEDAADDVDGGDEQARDRVALHELRRAVHRAVEVGLARDDRSRRRAPVASSISPAPRSASMAICLPGIASRVKRAATSATRPAPFVMTMKLMPTRIRKSTRPTA